jgi:thioredoxin reductase (NADPH)
MLDYQCIIIGSGPAGLTAATYLQSGGVKTLLVGNSHGGQMRKSGMLENLPFLGGTVVRGWSHAARMVTQCDKFGVVTMQDIVTNLHSQAPDKGWRVDTKHNGSIYAPTVLLATGVYPKQIHLTDNTHPHLHYLPDLDSVGHLGGQTVTIVGGGNSAAQAALYAAGKGAQVTMLARQPIATTMSQYMWDRINRHPKILVRGGTQIVKATHVGRVGYTVLGDNTYTLHNYDADQVWVYAGLQPRTQWLANAVVAVGRRGGRVRHAVLHW